jgi:fatty acid desaturase
LIRRSDAAGLKTGAGWIVLLIASGYLLSLSLGTCWIVPAMLVYSVFIAVPAYAFSHDCAHGTAFRTRWLNKAVFWMTSLLYFEKPLHRRYAHASHHTHTWIPGCDAQMPYMSIPLTFWGWVEEVLGRFIYCNMNYHIEHHLYPTVPFYTLLDLSRTLGEQLPKPDPGFWKTNIEVLKVVIARSLGKNDRSALIRQVQSA